MAEMDLGEAAHKLGGNVKKCSRKDCSQINPQPEKNFGACKRLPSGLRPECNYCRRIESAKKYKEDPEKWRIRRHRYFSKDPDAFRKKQRDAYFRSKPYSKYRKVSCENCGFKALDLCQLDVDHIVGDHYNNEPSNLQTLCANCHRLKTKLARNGPYHHLHMKDGK